MHSFSGWNLFFLFTFYEYVDVGQVQYIQQTIENINHFLSCQYEQHYMQGHWWSELMKSGSELSSPWRPKPSQARKNSSDSGLLTQTQTSSEKKKAESHMVNDLISLIWSSLFYRYTIYCLSSVKFSIFHFTLILLYYFNYARKHFLYEKSFIN